MNKLRNTAIVIACGVAINLVPAGYAWACTCYGDAAFVWQDILTQFTPFVTSLIGGAGASAEQTIEESGAAVRAEITKSALADKAVEEGLEANRQQQQLNATAAQMVDKLQQPVTTCSTMAATANIGAVATGAHASAFADQAKQVAVNTANISTAAVVERNWAATNQKFCTPDDAARGICTVNTSSAYVNLAGADTDSSYLFQGKNGSASYDGVDTATSTSPQSDAVDGLIGRIVGGMPPEALRGQGAPGSAQAQAYYQGSPTARAYVEVKRRYDAMMSMATFSLEEIKQMHKTQQGLGTATKMDTISAAGYTTGKADMSYAEMVERFVATKFSPDSVQALSTAVEPEVILRDMNQMSAFQLWMSYQGMVVGQRQEALMAHQLVLMADDTLRPQIDSQRGAAVHALSAQK
jgi:hypothetical protein